jgi:F420-dependent oxidoreductase-like protein
MALLKVSISVGGYDQSGMGAVAEYVQAAEAMGVDCAWSAEAWGRDAVSSLAFLAARTSRIRLGTGIMQISARVPSMTAMSALSLDSLSGGRFILGLGVSGPQVVEGLQGQDYSRPLTRLKETVDVIRMAFRGEKLRYEGQTITLPRPGGEGKPIRLDYPPTEIPIYLATLGPKSLEYTGEAADGWLGTSFSPDRPEAHLDFIRRGAEKAGRKLSDIHLNAACSVGIGEDVEALIDARRPGIAFQMGAMGSARTNFYNEAFQRAGFQDEAKEIQRLWIDGRRDEAAKMVPDQMITDFGAVGTPEMVRKRFETYAAAGIGGITVRFDNDLDAAGQLKQLEKVMELVD